MLDQVIKKYTIEVVISRTKISKRNLEKLSYGQFEDFTRPQAYGFLKILEREFDEDFSELRAALDAWDWQSQMKQSEIFLDAHKEESTSNKRWIVALLVIVTALMAFYLFQQEFSTQEQVKTAVPPLSVEKKQEEHATKEKPLETSTPQTDLNQSEAVVEHVDENGSEMEGQQEVVDQVEQNQTQVQAAESVTEEETKPYVPIENTVVTPLVKLWIGVIDLKTKKRLAKVTDQPYEIESYGKKLLLTGHGRFEVSDAFGNLFKYNDPKKHYFLIEDGNIQEIDLKTFKALNGGRGW
ncbi:MAG: hypothetical protein DSY46_06110 [Hydrogenimonas sp.]|nr:MAG: hypothetical protein DSY46_06110 [Hydrogenimonas sp.]